MMQVMGNSEDISAFNASNPGDGAFRHELEVFLSRASEATTWHVERVIKQSDFETTELVRGCGCWQGRQVHPQDHRRLFRRRRGV